MKNSSRFMAVIPVLTTALLLGGCATDKKFAEVPVPVNFKSESMMKLQSVSHWNNVALDMAAGVANKYSAGNGCIPGFGCKTPIYVSEPTPETQFSKAFHTQLVSALVNQGLPVLKKEKQQATTVEIDIQIVSSANAGSNVEYDQAPTELVNGVWVVRDLNDTAVHKFKNLTTGQWSLGEANKNAWFRSPQSKPGAEMLVTVSFVNDSQYIARTSNMYYLDSDAGYVVPPKAVEATVPVAAVPVEAKNTWGVRVVGDCTPERCFKN